MRALGLFFLLLFPLVCCAQILDDDDRRAQTLYRSLKQSTNSSRLQVDIAELARFGPRLAGSRGERNAREYMVSALKAMGGGNVTRQAITLTVPETDPGALIRYGNTSLPVYPLWPNLVTPSVFDGEAPMVYGEDGSPAAMKGKEIEGRIVLLDFGSGDNWRWLAEEGAAAIVYLPIDPNSPNPRLQAEAKFADAPVRCPRFYLASRPPIPAGETRARLTCRQSWKRVPSENVTIDFPGEGSRATLMVATDSMSAVPDLAYGGEGAASMAATLELVRLLKPLKGRPIRVALLSGHGLALAGSRAYVDRLIDTQEPVLLAASIDLVTQSKTLGVFSKGMYYEPREEVTYGVRIFTTNLRDHATVIAEPMGFSDSRVCLQDVTNNSDGRDWTKALPGRYALDSEPFLQAGLNAVSFSGVDDNRARVDTPLDTADRVNLENLTSQTSRIAGCMARALLDSTDPSITNRYRLNLAESRGSRFSLAGGFATLDGQTLGYDPERGFLPSVPMPGTLVSVKGRAKTLFGVRGAMVDMSDEGSNYRVVGLPPLTTYIPANQRPTFLSAFGLDTDGRIVSAAANGIMGSESYPLWFDIKTSERNSPIVLFPCETIDLYSVRDPQDQTPISDLHVFDAETNGAPPTFGMYAISWLDPKFPELVEDAACIFVKPGTKFKLADGGGSLVVTGPNEEGVDAKWHGSLARTVATDLLHLNQTRIDLFAKHHILTPYASEAQKEIENHLKTATEAAKVRDWALTRAENDAAWGLALRVYPLVRGTANDVVNGVVFYLLLLLPFSIFLERLLFGSRLLTKRLTVTLAIFLAVFMALRFLHPAFEIVSNPWMVFVAFVMGSLSLVVAVMIISKFESGLSDDKAERTGLREVTLRRGGSAAVAFALALSNLRRRKLRTWLTATTLMFTTFLVMGFVGIVPRVQVLANETANPAAYSGLLVRYPGMDPLSPALVRRFEQESERICRRVYASGADSGATPTISLYGDALLEVRSVAGFDADEPTDVQGAVVAGRWLRPGETGALIVSKDAGKAVGSRVTVFGRPMEVVGLFDPAKLAAVHDLDGDGVMAPDFSLSETRQTQTQSRTAAFRSYLRFDPKVCAISSAADALAMGGQTRSLAAPMANGEAVRAKLEDLMPRLRLNLYGGIDGKVSQFSAQIGSSSTGLGLVLIQLIIAALFVLNTMLASVHERRGEISILSAIGLAPNQIANLFFAESTVYGVVGAVGGYLIAQLLGRIAQSVPAMAGLTLNFSSTTAVLAALLVFVTVLISTIYPARVGAKMANPSRPDDLAHPPVGHVWDVTLPFTVGAQDVEKLLVSYNEWLAAHEAFSVGNFVAQGVRREGEDIEAEVSLIPYDLGVSQGVRIRLVPSPHVPEAFDLSIHLQRISGDEQSWHSLNQAFFAQIRRHFLTWQAARS